MSSARSALPSFRVCARVVLLLAAPALAGADDIPLVRIGHQADAEVDAVTVGRGRGHGPRLHEVSVNNNFFSPQSLSIAVGDTVRWTNVTGIQHNVVSCFPGQSGCDGTTANESFSSGSPSGFWVHDHTFTSAGSNPYVCQPHAPFMVGTVDVSGPAAGPPGVPDGNTGTAITVRKLSADGASLALYWDTTACSGAGDHQILFGTGAGLPDPPGGIYLLDGSRCSIGLVSPFGWDGVPAVSPSAFLWFLVVATDGSATEGSWGRDAAGFERSGPGPGGASGECGIAARDLSNACGH